jgi:hypothetical protein
MDLTDTELDILLILSDERGHPLREIALELEKYESNIKRVLEGLEKDIAGEGEEALHIHPTDIKDIIGLASKIKEAKDPLSHHIRENLTPGMRKILDGDLSQFEHAPAGCLFLIMEINRLLDRHSLFDASRFAKIILNDATKLLMASDPGGLELLRLNRLLLEDYYRNEIANYQKPMIYRGTPRKTTNPKSRHPNQLEFPYYINHDLFAFQIIVDNFKNRLSQYKMEIDQLEASQGRKAEKIQRTMDLVHAGTTANSVLPEDVDIAESKCKEYSTLSSIFWDEFNHSEYVINLIRGFGLSSVIGIIGDVQKIQESGMIMSALTNKAIMRKRDLELSHKILNDASEKLAIAKTIKDQFIDASKIYYQTK